MKTFILFLCLNKLIITINLNKGRILYEIPEEIQNDNIKGFNAINNSYFKLKEIESKIDSFQENAIFKYDDVINRLRKLQNQNKKNAKNIKKDIIKKIILKELEQSKK